MTEPSSDPIATTERLARALESYRGRVVNTRALAIMIDHARAGHYDDYQSPLINPIGQLVHDARSIGLAGLARDAMRGMYDGTQAEADAWARSPEGQQTFRKFRIPPFPTEQ